MGSPWKVFAALAGIFMAGTVFGGFFALGIGQRIMHDRQQPPLSPQLLRQYIMRLELTPVQMEKIKPIVDAAEKDVGTIQKNSAQRTAAELKPVLEKAESDFAAMLTAEQKAKLAELKKTRQRFDDFSRGGRGPLPGGNSGRSGPVGNNGQRGGQQPGRGGNPSQQGGQNFRPSGGQIPQTFPALVPATEEPPPSAMPAPTAPAP